MAGHEFLMGADSACADLSAHQGEFTDELKQTKDNERKLIYEKSNIDGHPAGVGLLCAFTRSASGQSSAGRMLSQFHDGGRVQCT